MSEKADRGPGRHRAASGRLLGRPVLAGAAGLVVCGTAAFALTAAAGDDGPRRTLAAPSAAPTPRGGPAPEETFGEDVPPRSSASAAVTTKPSRSASASPSPSGSASPSASASPSQGGSPSHPSAPTGGLAASYTTTNSWGSGFIGTVTVVNRGTTTVPSWQLSAVFPGRTILSAWTNSGSTSTSHAGNRLATTGRSLGPGQSIQIGFQANGGATAPSSCSLNGRPCSG
ncbi:cellulose binding domain-containing protein [Actinomadura kijaniata]|uniref:cellulose binding domain-containing protein n=1 Tax=Actinomadura kijaniata TaxID=46161 RepID=UPI003F1D8D12